MNVTSDSDDNDSVKELEGYALAGDDDQNDSNIIPRNSPINLEVTADPSSGPSKKRKHIKSPTKKAPKASHNGKVSNNEMANGIMMLIESIKSSNNNVAPVQQVALAAQMLMFGSELKTPLSQQSTLPHFNLFRHLFVLRPLSTKDNQVAIGGVGVQLHKKEAYIHVPLKTGNRNWKDEWFYCDNSPPVLADFTGSDCSSVGGSSSSAGAPLVKVDPVVTLAASSQLQRRTIGRRQQYVGDQGDDEEVPTADAGQPSHDTSDRPSSQSEPPILQLSIGAIKRNQFLPVQLLCSLHCCTLLCLQALHLLFLLLPLEPHFDYKNHDVYYLEHDRFEQYGYEASTDIKAPLWDHVTIVERGTGEGNTRWKCKYCPYNGFSSYTRVEAHLLQIRGKGVGCCPKVSVEMLSEMRREFKAPAPCGGNSKKKRGPANALEKAWAMQDRKHLDALIARSFYSGGILEVANLSLDEPELQAVSFGDVEVQNEENEPVEVNDEEEA
ncbi:hypothetical protein PR202_ga12650 [Eleusine coracana subsp. coracana]|uniref:Uncharacterized protein n=1 Tax=Eleusine coracana subsp. coracana TaxID=191504 RepID=A0AAV5CCS5_ELECO|nr:hypothetical protein PR202_ga12650 [Eleusine coracana subsp. coracana]